LYNNLKIRKMDNKTLLIVAGVGLAFYAMSMQNALPRPPVNFPPSQLPPPGTSAYKAAIIFSIFKQLLATGMSIYDAAIEAKKRADYEEYVKNTPAETTAEGKIRPVTYEQWKSGLRGMGCAYAGNGTVGRSVCDWQFMAGDTPTGTICNTPRVA